jgi:hypothetical protein
MRVECGGGARGEYARDASWRRDVILARAGHGWLGTGGRLFKRGSDTRGRVSASVVWMKVSATGMKVRPCTIVVPVLVSEVKCALLRRAFATIDRARFEAQG